MSRCVIEIHATGVESLQPPRQYSPMLILGKWKVMEQRHSSCHHPGLCTAIAEGAKQGIVYGPRPISRWFYSTKLQVCTQIILHLTIYHKNLTMLGNCSSSC